MFQKILTIAFDILSVAVIAFFIFALAGCAKVGQPSYYDLPPKNQDMIEGQDIVEAIILHNAAGSVGNE